VQVGIVISNVSDLYSVELQDGKIYNCSARGKLKNKEISPVAGDWVEVEIIDEKKLIGVIHIIQPRKKYIKRPKMSNISQMIFVISAKQPKPDLKLLDKQLAYAEYMQIKPLIVLNKIDLEDEDIIYHIMDIYTKIGYKVIKTNAKQGIGIENITQQLKNEITAFSGNSGVGKSTLLNNIFKNNITQEGLISEKSKRGKNTTTQVRLYKLDDNSYVADTPGFSTFEIDEIESLDLAHYFLEFIPHINNCQFVGCSHIKEQNCGVKKALENGEISQERYNRYCEIYEEMKKKEARKW